MMFNWPNKSTVQPQLTVSAEIQNFALKSHSTTRRLGGFFIWLRASRQLLNQGVNEVWKVVQDAMSIELFTLVCRTARELCGKCENVCENVPLHQPLHNATLESSSGLLSETF
jgi:hypothetical protein